MRLFKPQPFLSSIQEMLLGLASEGKEEWGTHLIADLSEANPLCHGSVSRMLKTSLCEALKLADVFGMHDSTREREMHAMDMDSLSKKGIYCFAEIMIKLFRTLFQS